MIHTINTNNQCSFKTKQTFAENTIDNMSENNAMELESLDAELPEEILNMSTADLEARTRLLDNEVSV